MKTHVIMLSKHFPAQHLHAGKPTFFSELLWNALNNTEATLVADDDDMSIQVVGRKIHTIRANFALWEKRINEVERGEACLSIRQWKGRPYRSRQIELSRLTKDNGVGIQMLEFDKDSAEPIIDGSMGNYKYTELASNDGLSGLDFINWLGGKTLEPFAIIHFTPFRY